MIIFLVLLGILTKNTCLEVKFIIKTEFFINNCNSDLDYILFEKLNYECSEDKLTENCKEIEGESYQMK